MDEQHTQIVIPSTPQPVKKGLKKPVGRVIAELTIGVITAIIVVAMVVIPNIHFPPSSLQTDAHTRYLVTSPQEISTGSIVSVWHWQHILSESADFLIAPYTTNGEDVEIDVQIRAPDDDWLNPGGFGVFVGLDAAQVSAYVCFAVTNSGGAKLIKHYPGWDEQTILDKNTSNEHMQFSPYLTVVVKVQQTDIRGIYQITESYNGKQVSQVTVSKYPANGLVGIFAASAALVRSFRIESLA